MNAVRVIVLLIAVATCVWLSQSAPPTNSGPRPAAPAHAKRVASQPFYGLAIQIDTSDDPAKRFGSLIDEVAELGADTLTFGTAGYMENGASGVIYVDQRKTPTPKQWRELFAIARRNGLRVILMPIVLFTEPRGSEWRGQIQPASWDQWFAQYRAFLNHFADIAAENHAEAMLIGSELVSTEKFTDEWTQTIEQVRQRYDGLLGYSANWDHYHKIQFWDKLDLIGMTTYHKLSDKPNPTIAQLIDSWLPIRQEILAWQANIDRPILFTEVGWCSQEGCSVEPWNYYHKQLATPAGMEEQRNCYEAFMRVWQDEPAVGGVTWWEWTSYGGGPDCYNYTPRGKPAEKLLKQWFHAQRQKSIQKRLAEQPAP